MYKIIEARPYSIELKDEYDNKVYVKWDGCVSFEGTEDREHICDVAEEIARLQEIQSIGRRHFGPEYWGSDD